MKYPAELNPPSINRLGNRPGRRVWLSALLLVSAVGVLLALRSGFGTPEVAAAPAAAPEIFASPVQAGCYLARLDRCKIHVDPFTINLASGTKLVQFKLVATRSRTGTQTVIYDFRPDQSNPVPTAGSTYTPSLVAKDFAASCGETYSINLQGQDTGDANLLSLGLTSQFTCPTGTYRGYLPLVERH